MGALQLVRVIFVLGPIAALVGLGLAITLQSGVVDLVGGQGQRRMMGNLAQMLLLLAGCVLVLALLQQLAGIRLAHA